MRYLFVLVTVFLSGACSAQEWEDRQQFGDQDAPVQLRVLSSTDTALFAPVLNDFVGAVSGVSVDYFVAATSDIDALVRASAASFDVVISSAMDLQFKLANDGYAQALDGLAQPGWTQWRGSLFAFTSEPAAIVINRAAFASGPVPRTRQNLIRVLRERPEVFRARVGTYDVRQSGLGYLFATQDARTSETFWRLMEVMGNLDVQLYCCSGAMIEDVASGKIAVAYNVLGSYALARIDLADKIDVILPEDFQTVMMRTALVSAETAHPVEAKAFVAHLLQRREERNAGSSVELPFLDLTRPAAEQSTIALEPALLTYLDRLKSQRFLAEWEDAIIQ